MMRIKVNKKVSYQHLKFVSLMAILTIFLIDTTGLAVTGTGASNTKESGLINTKNSEPASVLDSDDLQKENEFLQAVRLYQEKSTQETYNLLWQNFNSLVSQLILKHKSPFYLLKSLKVLPQIGFKIIETTGNSCRLYTFNPIIKENGINNRSAFLQWTDQSPQTIKTKSRKAHAASVAKTQILTVPANVELKEAYLLSGASKNKTNLGVRYLCLYGTDVQTGNNWLTGLRLAGASWIAYPSLWQDLPPFLLQDSHARIKVSGNTLVIAVSNQSANGAGQPTTYELNMPFVEDHFAFSTKEAQDSANAVARQFLLALQYKRADMVKVWLADPQLASIPGYLGLYNRTANNPPLRLINMSSPFIGGARFRLITSTKDDLIVDVGKIKGQWLVKALFIAPSDNLAREISRYLPNNQSVNSCYKPN